MVAIWWAAGNLLSSVLCGWSKGVPLCECRDSERARERVEKALTWFTSIEMELINTLPNLSSPLTPRVFQTGGTIHTRGEFSWSQRKQGISYRPPMVHALKFVPEAVKAAVNVGSENERHLKQLQKRRQITTVPTQVCCYLRRSSSARQPRVSQLSCTTPTILNTWK